MRRHKTENEIKNNKNFKLLSLIIAFDLIVSLLRFSRVHECRKDPLYRKATHIYIGCQNISRERALKLVYMCNHVNKTGIGAIGTIIPVPQVNALLLQLTV